MTLALRHFVETCKAIASERGLPWNPRHTGDGVILDEDRWNLSALAGLPPPAHYLSNLGWRRKEAEVLSALPQARGIVCPSGPMMPASWRDFYQATVLTSVTVERVKPDSALGRGRAVRILAMCASETEPSELTGDQVRLAYNVALRLGGGTSGRPFLATMRRIDSLHLAARAKLAAHCTPYPEEEALAAQHRIDGLVRRSRTRGGRPERVLGTLQERKDVLKLPDTAAFWELCRIAFTEEPRSVYDLQLFAAARIHIVAGLRAGEVSLLPLDWERWQEWTDIKGVPAGKRGGISRSLSIRHFAEKQGSDKGSRGLVLVPRRQHVVDMFEDVVLETLHEVEEVTRPMRETLRQQIASNRFFPDLDGQGLVPAWEMYVRITGNMRVSAAPAPEILVRDYLQGTPASGRVGRRFDPAALDEILAAQAAVLASPMSVRSKDWRLRRCESNMDHALNSFFARHAEWFVPRDATGALMKKDAAGRTDWNNARFLVSQVEAALPRWDKRRLPDHAPFTLSDGTLLHPHQMLFLKPKCTSIGARGASRETAELLVHLGRYFGIGKFSKAELQNNLAGPKNLKHLTLFARYGETDADRSLTMNTHAARHLQNTELRRRGVSDAILTKRFNRTSVQQSQVYDHRSLQERLDEIDLPEGAADRLGPRAAQTFKLIASGRVSGPLVDEFRRIQRLHGDDVAFDYLVAEADGLHITPYGFCVNAFTVDPCPRHLECFNGCRHLARSEKPGEQRRLEVLRDRMAAVVAKIEAEPEGRPGRANQLRHARTRLENIEKALATRPGARPFPDGPDLHQRLGAAGRRPSVLDGPAPGLRRPEGGKPEGRGTAPEPAAPRRPELDMDDA